MKNAKKAELSLNIIVIAAISLIILVILSVLIFDSSWRIRKATECESLQGVCVSDYYRNCAEYAEVMGMERSLSKDASGRCPANSFCCIPIWKWKIQKRRIWV